MKTAKGVYLNISESDIFYSYSGFDFYFSSNFNKRRFIENIQNYINIETARIQNKYDVNITLTIFLAVALYKKIEKRGFKIISKINEKELTKNVLFGNMILNFV